MTGLSSPPLTLILIVTLSSLNVGLPMISAFFTWAKLGQTIVRSNNKDRLSLGVQKAVVVDKAIIFFLINLISLNGVKGQYIIMLQRDHLS